MNEAAILEVHNYSISFGELEIIHDLELSLYSGQITAIIGSSGSGKSLLANAIMNILPNNAKTSGELIYQGRILTAERIKALRGSEIALVPQSITSLDPLMRVGKQLCYNKKDIAKAEKALKRYGLTGVEKLYPYELSGGMARRVLIATAVMRHPHLVIADEPTPGLDTHTARWILRHFREIADEGAAVLLITHDLELALTVADRVVVFYAGMTIEEAAASDFETNSLRHPYTKALRLAMPANGFVYTGGTQPYPDAMPKGCPYTPRCPNFTIECENEIILRRLRNGIVRCIHAE